MKRAIGALLLCGAVAGCSQNGPDEPPEPPPAPLRPMLATFKELAAPATRPKLLDELRAADAATRQAAAAELAAIGAAAAVPTLLLALKDEKDPLVRVHFADALTQLDNLSALPDVIAGMQDQATAQAAGLVAMRVLQDHFRPPGTAPTYQFLRQELRMLHRLWQRNGRTPRQPQASLEPQTKARLAKHLVDLEGFQLRPVDEARYVLTHTGAAALPLLEMALRAEETYLREHALEVLRRFGPVAHPLHRQVLALLKDPLSRVQAARTLGAIGAQIATPRLIELLQDPDPEMRCAAAEALGPLADRRAIDALRPLLADTRQAMDLRVRAAFSLALLDPQSGGLAFLMARLEADDYHRPTLEELIEHIGRE